MGPFSQRKRLLSLSSTSSERTGEVGGRNGTGQNGFSKPSAVAHGVTTGVRPPMVRRGDPHTRAASTVAVTKAVVRPAALTRAGVVETTATLTVAVTLDTVAIVADEREFISKLVYRTRGPHYGFVFNLDRDEKRDCRSWRELACPPDLLR
jgi:hypothetical protein